jgi:hypothetical protein
VHVLLLKTFLYVGIIKSLFFHPVHVSLANVEYAKDENKFRVTMKFYADDFQRIIDLKYEAALNLGKENELKETPQLISQYVNETFKLKINHKKEISLTFVKYELNDVSVFLYFECPYAGKVNNILVTNWLMTELYKDQTNLFIFNYLAKEEGYTFNYNTREVNIDLKRFLSKK